jgi:ABC-2 type transport system permease protein
MVVMAEQLRRLTREIPIVIEARTGAIFYQTMRDNLPGVLAWGGGYSVLLALVTLLYPALQANNTLFGVASSLGLLGLAGGDAVLLEALSGYEGYLALQALTWAPLVFAVYLIPQALSAVIREEERGTLDILLSAPIRRWRLVTEKVCAVLVSLVCILFLMWLTLLVSTRLVGVEIALGHLFAGIWHIVPITLTIFAMTLLISVSVRSSRTAGGWAALFVIVSYFLRVMGDMLNTVDWIIALKQVSIFNYYRVITTLSLGVQPQYDLVLLALAAALFGFALWRFERRDIGV